MNNMEEECVWRKEGKMIIHDRGECMNNDAGRGGGGGGGRRVYVQRKSDVNFSLCKCAPG